MNNLRKLNQTVQKGKFLNISCNTKGKERKSQNDMLATDNFVMTGCVGARDSPCLALKTLETMIDNWKLGIRIKLKFVKNTVCSYKENI